MKTVSSTLAAAIGSPEQILDVRLRMDWDRDGWDVDTSSAALGGLVDNFPGSSLDTTKWTATGTPTVAGNQCTLPRTAGGTHITSKALKLTGSGVSLKLSNPYVMQISAVDGSGWWMMWVDWTTPASPVLQAVLHDNSTAAVPNGVVGPVPVAYSATAHAWWRCHESDGYLYWDTSPDGLAWTNRFVAPYVFTAASVNLDVYQVTATSSPSGSSIVSNVNTASWPALDDLSSDVGRLTVDRTLTTEYPDAARFVAGNASATMDADLDGGLDSDERDPAAWYYSPANASSPIASKTRLARPVTVDVVYQTDAGQEMVRVFTAASRDLVVSARDHIAKLSANSRLLGTVTLPGVSGVDDGLNATWVISYALAAARVFASPPRMDQGADALQASTPVTRCWMPMHGSQHPFLADTTGQHYYRTYGRSPGSGSEVQVRPQFVPGPYVLGAYAYWRAADDYLLINIGSFALAPGRSVLAQDWSCGQMDLWIRSDASSYSGGGDFMQVYLPAAAGSAYVRVGLTASTRIPYMQVYDGSTLYSSTVPTGLAADGAWHSLRFLWDVTNRQMIVQADGTSYSYNLVGASTAGLPATDGILGTCTLVSLLPVAEVQINSLVRANARAVRDIPFTAGAVLDQSTLELVAQIERTERQVWDLLAEIADAEQAVVHRDEDGIYRYRTRARLVDTTGSVVQRTITAEGAITDLEVTQAVDQIANVVTVPSKTITVQRGVVVLQDKTVYTLGPLRTTRIVVTFQNPVLFLNTSIFSDGPPTNYSWPVTTNQYGMVSARNNSDGSGGSVLVTAKVVAWDANSVTLDVTNTLNQTVYLANNDTQPTNTQEPDHASILLWGDMAVVGDDVTARRTQDASITTYGAQNLSLQSSQWVQQLAVADGIALELSVELGQPGTVIDNLEVVGDPRSQLGDRVRIQDSDGIALDRQYWLSGKQDNLQPGQYLQRLAAREAGGIFMADSSLADGPDRAS